MDANRIPKFLLGYPPARIPEVEHYTFAWKSVRNVRQGVEHQAETSVGMGVDSEDALLGQVRLNLEERVWDSLKIAGETCGGAPVPLPRKFFPARLAPTQFLHPLARNALVAGKVDSQCVSRIGVTLHGGEFP